jgi:predicted ATPase
VISSKERPGRVRGVEGLTSPMIGRDPELEQLKQVVQKTEIEKKGGFAMIFGEAGIGKSRLLAELKSQIDQNIFSVHEGRSLTYRRSVAYWIFFDLMRDYLGVSANAPEAQVRARLAELVEEILGERASEVVPYLEHLLSLKPTSATAAARISQLDADQLRQQIFIAVRDLFIAESKRHPVLLIFDDLHWADEASLDLLKFLLDSVGAHPLNICGISRPVDDKIAHDSRVAPKVARANHPKGFGYPLLFRRNFAYAHR